MIDLFSLRGYLDRLYDDPARAARTPPSRLRELYKMYVNEAAAVARVERLPAELRALVEKAVMEFGGILPKGLFERMDTAQEWDGRCWGHVLEESLVGTVERLDLSRYGIQHNDETLLVFNEVALAWLRRVAVPGDPDRPHEEAALGVDLVSNISRFMGFILDHNVRFTVRGDIFKTTEKRLLEELIPNPGRELSRAEVLDFIYAFARHERIIESTGERTFALTAHGRDWESQDLEHKLRSLLDYAIEERPQPGRALPPGAHAAHPDASRQAHRARHLVRPDVRAVPGAQHLPLQPGRARGRGALRRAPLGRPVRAARGRAAHGLEPGELGAPPAVPAGHRRPGLRQDRPAGGDEARRESARACWAWSTTRPRARRASARWS